MHPDVESILFSEEQLKKRVEEIGAQITRDFAGKQPLFVGVLKGSFMFMADLMRCVDLSCSVDFMAVSSYGNKSVSTGAVKINKDLSADIEGLDVIMVEDILDSGKTLDYLRSYLNGRKPASISIVTLLDKPARRTAPITAALKFRMPSWLAMDSTMRRNTATCRMSAFSNPAFTKTNKPSGCKAPDFSQKDVKIF